MEPCVCSRGKLVCSTETEETEETVESFCFVNCLDFLSDLGLFLVQ